MDFDGFLKEFNRILKEFIAKPMDFNGIKENSLQNLWISIDSKRN